MSFNVSQWIYFVKLAEIKSFLLKKLIDWTNWEYERGIQSHTFIFKFHFPSFHFIFLNPLQILLTEATDSIVPVTLGTRGVLDGNNGLGWEPGWAGHRSEF